MLGCNAPEVGGVQTRGSEMNTKILELLTLAATVALSGAAQAASYEYTTIDYPGADQTQVFGTNERGLVTGTGIYDNGTSIAFVYNPRTDVFTPLPTLPGYVTSGIGINEPGVVVGVAQSTDTFVQTGFIYRGGATSLFSYPGAENTVARDVNNRGLVTGYATGLPDVSTTGFTYDPATGVFVEIVPSPFTIAQGINERGEIVGSASFPPGAVFPGSPPGDYGFLRSRDGQVTFFRVNGFRTRARGISDKGEITGAILTPTGSKGFVVRLRTRGDYQALTVPDGDLLEVPGAISTFTQDIDNQGNISGSYSVLDGNGQPISHGFMARPKK